MGCIHSKKNEKRPKLPKCLLRFSCLSVQPSNSSSHTSVHSSEEKAMEEQLEELVLEDISDYESSGESENADFLGAGFDEDKEDDVEIEGEKGKNEQIEEKKEENDTKKDNGTPNVAEEFQKRIQSLQVGAVAATSLLNPVTMKVDSNHPMTTNVSMAQRFHQERTSSESRIGMRMPAYSRFGNHASQPHQAPAVSQIQTSAMNDWIQRQLRRELDEEGY